MRALSTWRTRAVEALAWRSQRRLIRRAARQACEAFASRQPLADAALFDEPFIRAKAMAILSGCLPGRKAKAEAVTAAWAAQWGFSEEAARRFAQELLPAALDFVALFERQLERLARDAPALPLPGEDSC